MKKGFTLIELLGIITILGLIIIVAVPAMIESNRASQDNKEEDFNNTIEVAARDYVHSCSSFDSCKDKAETFESLFDANGNSVNIYGSELAGAGFLKGDLVNPKSGNTISKENKCIKVTNNNGNLEVKYGGC